MSAEFDRKTLSGDFAKVKVKQVTGVGVDRIEYLINGLMAFVFGYKILYLVVETGDGFSPQDHVFSTEGSWLLGFGAMAFSLWRTWVADKKQRGEAPSETIVEMNASARMSNITTVALLSGFLGAKVFHLLETPSEIHWDTLLVDLLLQFLSDFLFKSSVEISVFQRVPNLAKSSIRPITNLSPWWLDLC